MCTAVTFQTSKGDTYFGRTMDFSYPLEPELYVVPKGYSWNNQLHTHTIYNDYSFIGTGQNISPIVFADGVNEEGFAAAVLYFPGCAQYDPVNPQDTSMLPVAATELVHFLLGQCACVAQAVSTLHTIRIVGIEDALTHTIAPLHWIIADKTGKCMTVEKTAGGLNIINNPAGVLSNSPDFCWHMTNLRNYMNVTPFQHQQEMWGPVALSPFGQGSGTLGLPGDYTPPSRFVKATYLKSHTEIPTDTAGAVSAGFHILEGVSIPKGNVMTERCAPDYTQYTAYMKLTTQEYFFRTYDNSQITVANLSLSLKSSTKIKSLGKLVQPIIFDYKEG